MDNSSMKNLSQQKQQSSRDLTMDETCDRRLRAIKSQVCLSNSKKRQIYNDSHINDRFAQLRLLTKQKDLLMSELNSLKEGAVTALLEKQQIIDRLKNQHRHHVYFQDEKQQMQKQLNKHMRRVKQLTEQRNEINQKYQKQRLFFFDQLYNKQAIIDELSSRIANLHVQNDDLADQNKKINMQLVQAQQNIQNMKSSIQQMRSQLLELYRRQQSKQKKEVSFNITNLLCSNCQQKISQNKQQNNLCSNDNLIDQLKVQHQIEIEQLTNFYEQQINIMKSICDKQISDPGYLKKTLQTQGISDQQQNQSVLDLFSIKSGYKSKNLLNLRTQLKGIKSLQSNDEDKSQFTNKYFSYESRPRLEQKDSMQSTKTVNIQQQNKINKYQQKIWVTKKQIIALISGGVLGAITWGSIAKLLSK